jgi:hypothetical protein
MKDHLRQRSATGLFHRVGEKLIRLRHTLVRRQIKLRSKYIGSIVLSGINSSSENRAVALGLR